MAIKFTPDLKLPRYTIVDDHGNNAKAVAVNPLAVVAIEEVPQKQLNVDIVLSGGIIYRVIQKSVDDVSAEIGAWLHQYGGK